MFARAASGPEPGTYSQPRRSTNQRRSRGGCLADHAQVRRLLGLHHEQARAADIHPIALHRQRLNLLVECQVIELV
jgi:hypothetical protein